MSSEPPTSRTFIVTGASRGIGQAIVEELIRRGARVLGVARNIQASSAPSEEKTSASRYMQADVTVEADRTRIIETAKRLFGRIDGVINNAGRAHRALASATTLEEFGQLVAVDGGYLAQGL